MTFIWPRSVGHFVQMFFDHLVIVTNLHSGVFFILAFMAGSMKFMINSLFETSSEELHELDNPVIESMSI